MAISQANLASRPQVSRHHKPTALPEYLCRHLIHQDPRVRILTTSPPTHLALRLVLCRALNTGTARDETTSERALRSVLLRFTRKNMSKQYWARPEPANRALNLASLLRVPRHSILRHIYYAGYIFCWLAAEAAQARRNLERDGDMPIVSAALNSIYPYCFAHGDGGWRRSSSVVCEHRRKMRTGKRCANVI